MTHWTDHERRQQAEAERLDHEHTNAPGASSLPGAAGAGVSALSPAPASIGGFRHVASIAGDVVRDYAESHPEARPTPARAARAGGCPSTPTHHTSPRASRFPALFAAAHRRRHRRALVRLAGGVLVIAAASAFLAWIVSAAITEAAYWRAMDAEISARAAK